MMNIKMNLKRSISIKCCANKDENADTSDCSIIKDISNIVITGFSDISLLQEEER